MEKQNDQHSEREISEEKQLEKLVEESDFFTCLFNEILLPIREHVSVFEAYRRLKKICDTSHGVSQPYFLDFKIVKKPSGNKLWNIELCFRAKERSHVYSESNIPLRETREIPPRGYLSCHRRGTFITYALWVNGKERWFDSFELACALLEKVVHADNIDELLLTI